MFRPKNINVLVHTRTCRTSTELKLLIGVAKSLFSNFHFDVDVGKRALGDINLMFGSTKNRKESWHIARQKVMNSGRALVLEDPVLRRGSVSVNFRGDYFRIGINGFLPENCRDFGNLVPKHLLDPNKFKFEAGAPKKLNFEKAMIVGQVPGDASLSGINIFDWIQSKYEDIQSMYRTIILRSPQIGHKEYLDAKFPRALKSKIVLGTFENKQSSLLDSDAVFTFSSTMAVEAFLMGTPTGVDSENSFVFKFITANNGSSKISKVNEVQQIQFLEELSGYEYCIEELKVLGQSFPIERTLREYFSQIL